MGGDMLDLERTGYGNSVHIVTVEESQKYFYTLL